MITSRAMTAPNPAARTHELEDRITFLRDGLDTARPPVVKRHDAEKGSAK
jgi:hypothetical protein